MQKFFCCLLFLTNYLFIKSFSISEKPRKPYIRCENAFPNPADISTESDIPHVTFTISINVSEKSFVKEVLIRQINSTSIKCWKNYKPEYVRCIDNSESNYYYSFRIIY